MTLKKLLLILLAIQVSRANFNFPIPEVEDECSQEGSIGYLLKDLIEQLNEVEYGVKDVGILQLMEVDTGSRISDLTGGVHHCIPKENPILRFSELPGKLSNHQEKSRECKRRRLAVTIIISDLQDSVSFEFSSTQGFSNKFF